jgi:hypothetical protein
VHRHGVEGHRHGSGRQRAIRTATGDR